MVRVIRERWFQAAVDSRLSRLREELVRNPSQHAAVTYLRGLVQGGQDIDAAFTSLENQSPKSWLALLSAFIDSGPELGLKEEGDSPSWVESIMQTLPKVLLKIPPKESLQWFESTDRGWLVRNTLLLKVEFEEEYSEEPGNWWAYWWYARVDGAGTLTSSEAPVKRFWSAVEMLDILMVNELKPSSDRTGDFEGPSRKAPIDSIGNYSRFTARFDLNLGQAERSWVYLLRDWMSELS